MTHYITLPGDWNRPWLLFRLLEVVESDWQMGETGFGNQKTGEQVGLAFGETVDTMRSWFANGGDLTRPELSDDLLDAIADHKSVIQIQVTHEDPREGLRLALRAANGVVDGGALGVHVMTSGLAHEADAFQALIRGLETSDDDGRQLFNLAVRYQVGVASTTIGMMALGLPDVVLPHCDSPDRAVGLLERTCFQLLDGETLPTRPDQRGGLENPYGVVTL